MSRVTQNICMCVRVQYASDSPHRYIINDSRPIGGASGMLEHLHVYLLVYTYMDTMYRRDKSYIIISYISICLLLYTLYYIGDHMFKKYKTTSLICTSLPLRKRSQHTIYLKLKLIKVNI